MSGHYGDLSKAQEEALAEFKAKADPLPDKPSSDDYYYLRLLRARKFNVKKAITHLHKHLEIRRKYGATTILQDWTPPEVLQKCFPGGFFGEDRDGHPVWYDSIGRLDFRGLHRSCQKDDVLKFKILHQVQGGLKLKEFSEMKGKHIETLTVVMDFEGLSLHKHYYWPGIEMVKEVLALGESSDPECVKQVFIVKAPPFFPMCYNVVKHILGEKTRQKMHILGSNWEEELQKYISPDQLPQAYGGTRCEPDPWCSDHLNPGCDVPPEYYLTNQTETEREEMDRVVVGRGGCCELEYQVELEGSLIRWEFISTGYNISYGLFYRDVSSKKKPKLEPVMPMKKADSHVVPEVGTYTCTAAGKYVVKFDNSYSWTRSKEVYFSIQVLPPNTEPCLPNVATGDEAATVTMDTDNNSDDEFHDCENT